MNERLINVQNTLSKTGEDIKYALARHKREAIVVAGSFGLLLQMIHGVPVAIADKLQGEIVKDIPTDIALPVNIDYFSERVQIFNGPNDTAFSVNLNRGGILLTQSAELNILGGLVSIDPENNPGKTQIIDVVALTDGVNISGVTKSGTFTRLDQEWINDEDVRDMAGLIDSALLAGEVQVGRTRLAGNCVAAGCNPTRLVRVAAYNLNDGKGTQFNAISDDSYRKP